MKEIFPQRIEIDLTGTGLVRVYHDIEIDIEGQKIQVRQKRKNDNGKDEEVQPVRVFTAPPELAAVVQCIADSVRDGVEFEFPSAATIKRLAKSIAETVPVAPVVLPDVKEPEKEAAVTDAPAASDLYPEAKGGE